MIFKNDVRYELTKDDYKKMSEFIGCSIGTQKQGDKEVPCFKNFPKAGVVVKPPKTLYYKDEDNNGKLQKPHLVLISFEQDVETTEGTVKWNYCKRPPVIKTGETPRYYEAEDGALFMTHRFVIHENQPDYLFYLICISKSGAHVNGTTKALYEIENKENEAILSNAKEIEKATVQALIFVDKMKMHKDDISRIAKAMRVPNIDGLSDEQIRFELMEKIKVMEAMPAKNGYKTFLEYTERTETAKDRVDILAMIQTAKDRGLIKFQGMSNKWTIINKQGKKIGEVCPLAPGRDKDESLIYFCTTDEEIGEVMTKLVKESDKEFAKEVAA